MNNPDLIPEDWDAAKAAILKHPCAADVYQAKLNVLADLHSTFGESQFELMMELREPRNFGERAIRMLYQQQISVEQCKAEISRFSALSVDLEVAEWWYSYCENQLRWLGRFEGAIRMRAYQIRVGLECEITEQQRDRYLKEATRDSFFRGNQLAATIDLVEKVRFQLRMGMATAGGISEVSAIGLAVILVPTIQRLWESSLNTFERSHKDPRYFEAESPEYLMEGHLKKWPMASEVSVLLRMERAAMRVELAKIPPRSVSNANNSEEESVPDPPPSEDSVKGEEPITECPPANMTVDFKRWAVGLEDGKKWWLFHFHWKQKLWIRRKQIHIPNGRQNKLLTAIAEGGGTLDRQKAIDAAKRDYPGLNNAEIQDRFKTAAKLLRREIRNAIADAIDSSVDASNDPIPLEDEEAWRAKIQVGYAELNDKKELIFRMHEPR